MPKEVENQGSTTTTDCGGGLDIAPSSSLSARSCLCVALSHTKLHCLILYASTRQPAKEIISELID